MQTPCSPLLVFKYTSKHSTVIAYEGVEVITILNLRNWVELSGELNSPTSFLPLVHFAGLRATQEKNVPPWPRTLGYPDHNITESPYSDKHRDP
jgi:hypothetical protein